MYILKTSAAFDSAHFLRGYDGKCANLHGHQWVIEVEVSGDCLQEQGSCRGMLIDFGEVKQAVRTLADSFDHALIYEKDSLKPGTEAALLAENFRLIPVAFRPTAENFARCFYEKLSEKGLPVYRVTVYETPDNCAVYEV
ncbi:MAG: 6-carboxytetrahydropterin synthase QueD [Lachnospiraceae bacterium]|nr:6-carboxytetrahydropterin synthase QueD [Lachnospiraceae bacterium]MDE7183705.1 6-carboxytetrahydropterin synthase QueD [Lachnospiraceae bacterium]